MAKEVPWRVCTGEKAQRAGPRPDPVPLAQARSVLRGCSTETSGTPGARGEAAVATAATRRTARRLCAGGQRAGSPTHLRPGPGRRPQSSNEAGCPARPAKPLREAREPGNRLGAAASATENFARAQPPPGPGGASAGSWATRVPVPETQERREGGGGGPRKASWRPSPRPSPPTRPPLKTSGNRAEEAAPVSRSPGASPVHPRTWEPAEGPEGAAGTGASLPGPRGRGRRRRQPDLPGQGREGGPCRGGSWRPGCG